MSNPVIFPRTGLRVGSNRIPTKYNEGIGIFKNTIDIDYDPEMSKNDSIYIGALQRHSIDQPIFLMDSSVVLTSNDLKSFTAQYGNLYKMDHSLVTKIASMEEQHTQAQVEAVQSRTIPKARYIYEDELTPEERRDNEAVTAKVTEEQV